MNRWCCSQMMERGHRLSRKQNWLSNSDIIKWTKCHAKPWNAFGDDNTTEKAILCYGTPWDVLKKELVEICEGVGKIDEPVVNGTICQLSSPVPSKMVCVQRRHSIVNLHFPIILASHTVVKLIRWKVGCQNWWWNISLRRTQLRRNCL